MPHHRDWQLAVALRLGGEAAGVLGIASQGGGEDVGVVGSVTAAQKDYEHLPETAKAMIYGAMSRLLRLRRLARAA
jgi:hypothetical protein